MKSWANNTHVFVCYLPKKANKFLVCYAIAFIFMNKMNGYLEITTNSSDSIFWIIGKNMYYVK